MVRFLLERAFLEPTTSSRRWTPMIPGIKIAIDGPKPPRQPNMPGEPQPDTPNHPVEPPGPDNLPVEDPPEEEGPQRDDRAGTTESIGLGIASSEPHADSQVSIFVDVF